MAESAHLWMWVTTNFLPDALWIIQALDFAYKRHGVWVKMSDAELSPVFVDDPMHTSPATLCKLGSVSYLEARTNCVSLTLGVRRWFRLQKTGWRTSSLRLAASTAASPIGAPGSTILELP